MLRLPKFEVATPTSLDEAVALLATPGRRAVAMAGGTDLLVNLKHRFIEADLVVSLQGLAALQGVTATPDGGLVIGALTVLETLAHDASVLSRAPALASAAAQVSGPQLRRMGTLGGNVLLDTRCRYINQTHFWRKALGHCLKKDGTVCHVVQGGKKCVAAASNDTAPALMTLGASVMLVGPGGERRVPVDALYVADGIVNRSLLPGEVLVSIDVPAPGPGHRGAYVKLRSREAIDFPQLGVAARLDVEGGTVSGADVCLVALQARPLRVKGVEDVLRGAVVGSGDFTARVLQAAALAKRQCRPLPNIPGDADYRGAMMPVFVRRALAQAAGQGG